MDSLDLTREQAAELRRQLAPSLRFLRRLHGRMEETAFSKADELWQLVETAYNAVHIANRAYERFPVVPSLDHDLIEPVVLVRSDLRRFAPSSIAYSRALHSVRK
jgi:hypothetical protein